MAECPVCKGFMAQGNFYCRLACYNLAIEQGLEDKEAYKDRIKPW